MVLLKGGGALCLNTVVYSLSSVNPQLLNLNTEVWYRTSTQEWVIDLAVSYQDVITSIVRFTGNTQLDALREMNVGINEVLQEVIDNVEPDSVYDAISPEFCNL